MEWWQVLLCIAINALWVVPLVKEVVIFGIRERINYEKQYSEWNKRHPDHIRIKCADCQYVKKETYYSGRYPHSTPNRVPVYCKRIKRGVSENTRCVIAEPPPECYQRKDAQAAYPEGHGKIYYSSYGDCYHSTPTCSSIRNSSHICISDWVPDDRRPCPKCWVEANGILYSKSALDKLKNKPK